jgi:hypothetical protein
LLRTPPLGDPEDLEPFRINHFRDLLPGAHSAAQIHVTHVTRILGTEDPEVLIPHFATRELKEIIKPGLHCITILEFPSGRGRLI